MKPLGYQQMRAGQRVGVSPTQAFMSDLPCSCVVECGRFMCVNRGRCQHVHFDELACPRHGRSNGEE